MPDVSRLVDNDKLPDYGIRDGQRCWLPVDAETFRRLIRAGGGQRWRAQVIGRALIALGLAYIEDKEVDRQAEIEVIETLRRDARSVFHREWARLGRPPKPPLSALVKSGRELEAAGQ